MTDISVKFDVVDGIPDEDRYRQGKFSAIRAALFKTLTERTFIRVPHNGNKNVRVHVLQSTLFKREISDRGLRLREARRGDFSYLWLEEKRVEQTAPDSQA
jgi:hypothetical protein